MALTGTPLANGPCPDARPESAYCGDRYVQTRETASFSTAEHRPVRVRGADVKAKEVLYNPITGQLRNPDAELERAQKEQTQCMERLQSAWGKQLEQENK